VSPHPPLDVVKAFSFNDLEEKRVVETVDWGLLEILKMKN
jgi:hypothetical protein